MNQKIISPKLAVALVLTGLLSGINTSFAKEREWIIKSNDTLSKIVERYYPSIRNKKAIILAIVQDNPSAFRRGSAHDLIVGKVLVLPDPERFKTTDKTVAETDTTLPKNANAEAVTTAANAPEAQSPTPEVNAPEVKSPAAAGKLSNEVTQKLTELEEGRKELEETLKLVEDENSSLQSMVGKYEEQKQAQDTQIAKLESQVKKLEASLKNTEANKAVTPESAAPVVATAPVVAPVDVNNEEISTISKQLAEKERVTETLKTQLAETKRQNDALQEELQTKITTMETSSSNSLPWMVSALLALVMLPLLWLLKQKMRALPTVSAGTSNATKATAPKIISNTAPKIAEPLANVSAATAATSTLKPAAPEVVTSEPNDDNLEADIKLDMARAYMDLRNASAAAEILQDVIAEGGSRQRQEAREILSFIS